MKSVLPLRLSPFEEYMLRDDRPAYPMHIWGRLRLRGSVDREALESALARALAEHPLMTAVVDASRKSRLQWESRVPQPLLIVWSKGTLQDASFGPIDMIQRPGLLVRGAVQGDVVELGLHLHHAQCDGMGLYAFLNDWLLHYQADVTGDESVRPEARNINQLTGRGTFWMSTLGLLAIVPRLLLGLPNTIRFVLHRATPLITNAPIVGEAVAPFVPGWLTQRLTAAETAQLRQRAKSLGTSLNNLLIRDLLMTLHRWQQQQGENQQNDWLRVSVPINLRRASEAQLPAANVVSMVFIDRRAPLLQQPAELLQSIQQQMNRIKRHRLGLIFPLMVGLLRSLGRLSRLTGADHCRSTTVLTNLGNYFATVQLPRDAAGRLVVGELTLEAFEVIAPLRPWTQVTFAVMTYAGELSINMHYDRWVLNETQARDILAQFAATLTEEGSE